MKNEERQCSTRRSVKPRGCFPWGPSRGSNFNTSTNTMNFRSQCILTLVISAAGSLSASLPAAEPAPIRVLIWDEQQPAQKQAYDNFLGNQIAQHLDGKPGLAVRSVRMDDPEQGLAADVLDNCDVLIWWGHLRHRDIKPERGRQIVERIAAGPAFAHRAALGALVDAVHRSHERARQNRRAGQAAARGARDGRSRADSGPDGAAGCRRAADAVGPVSQTAGRGR